MAEGGDYFLFDGSDSHSMMLAYDAFVNSNAIYLFKNQIHRNKDNYKVPKAFNKWYFGSGSDLDLSYDIPDNIWNRIKLTGWNMLSNVPSHKNYIKVNENKPIDICAIFGTGGDEPTPAHGVTTHILYREHRENIIKVVDELSKKYNVASSRQPFDQYMKTLYDSKICISPYGMGEIRQGDGESIQLGTIICKEDMSLFDFGSNVWIEDETYIPFDYDCSNLYEQLDNALKNYNPEIVNNMRRKYLEEYDYHKLCKRWYDIFRNIDGISDE